MRDFPKDPMRQHNIFVAAFCDDLFDLCLNGGTGTPRADRVMEISRQVNDLGDCAALREIGDDYPGSSCQRWCHEKAEEAEAMGEGE